MRKDIRQETVGNFPLPGWNSSGYSYILANRRNDIADATGSIINVPFLSFMINETFMVKTEDTRLNDIRSTNEVGTPPRRRIPSDILTGRIRSDVPVYFIPPAFYVLFPYDLGFASIFVRAEHLAFRALGTTLKASSFRSVSSPAGLTAGFARIKVLGVAVKRVTSTIDSHAGGNRVAVNSPTAFIAAGEIALGSFGGYASVVILRTAISFIRSVASYLRAPGRTAKGSGFAGETLATGSARKSILSCMSSMLLFSPRSCVPRSNIAL